MAYSVGESVSGIVSGVTDYGAFVRLDDGSTGMIHISKLSSDFVSDIRSVVKKGDSITATVISADNGKIALSCIADKPKKRENKGGTDFESMLSTFKSQSDERLARLNREKKRRR